VALPAGRAAIDRYLSLLAAWPTAANPQQRPAPAAWWDRQTDGRTDEFHSPRSALLRGQCHKAVVKPTLMMRGAV